MVHGGVCFLSWCAKGSQSSAEQPRMVRCVCSAYSVGSARTVRVAWEGCVLDMQMQCRCHARRMRALPVRNCAYGAYKCDVVLR